MPGTLPDDRLDYDSALRLLGTDTDTTHPFYRCVIEVVRRTNSPRSARTYAYGIKLFLAWLRDRGVDPLAATHDVLSDWQSSMAHLSTSTQDARSKLVRALYDEAVERELLARSPARRIKHIRRHHDDGPPGLTQAQAQQLLRVIHSDLVTPGRRLHAHRNYLVFFLALKLGLRSVELRRITFGDFTRGPNGGVLVVRRKGGKVSRLHVSPDLIVLVDAWAAALADVGIRVRPADFVVCHLGKPSPHGLGVHFPLRPVTSVTVYTFVREWLEIAGVPGPRLGPHRLRRTAATMAWEGGADLFSIQAMLGHTDPKTTATHYIRPAEEILRPASDKIELVAA